MTLRSPTPKIRVALDAGVARVLIDNAPRRNAFDFAMWQALPEIMGQIEAETAARVVVLAGAPGLPFCAGADISEFSTLRATAEVRGLDAAHDPALHDEIVRRFTSADYGWMWPFPRMIRGWIARALAEIEHEGKTG